MSKHNKKHDRTKSRYPFRLAARGLSKAPRMRSLDALRQASPGYEPQPRVRSRRQWASFAEWRREQGWDWDRHYGRTA